VREGTQAGGEGEGEAGFPRSREGLDPRTLGRCLTQGRHLRCVTQAPQNDFSFDEK